MSSFNWRQGVAGAAGAIADVAGTVVDTEIKKGAAIDLERIRADVMAQREERLAELMAQREERLAEFRLQGQKSLIDYQNRDRKEIGRTIADARRPVDETYASEEGDYKTTRTPSRAEAFAAGERRAMELGDFEGAEHLRKARAPNTVKVGQDETIINTDTGQVAYQNKAGAERRATERTQKHEDKLAELRAEYQLKAGLEKFKQKNGEGAATALMKNVNFLVDKGIVKDATEAFNKLRTSPEKPESQAISSVMGMLMKNPSYRGRGGMGKAKEDATAIVRDIRGGSERDSSSDSSPSNARSFMSKEEVRSAYKAGKIDRNSAVRELGRFGFDAR